MFSNFNIFLNNFVVELVVCLYVDDDDNNNTRLPSSSIVSWGWKGMDRTGESVPSSLVRRLVVGRHLMKSRWWRGFAAAARDRHWHDHGHGYGGTGLLQVTCRVAGGFDAPVMGWTRVSVHPARRVAGHSS